MKLTAVLLLIGVTFACGKSGPAEPDHGGGGGVGAATAGVGGAAGTGGQNAPVFSAAAVDACDRIAELQCQAETECCDDTSRKSGSKQACIAQQLDGCVNTLRLEAIGQDLRTAYDADSAATAFDGFAQTAASCDLSIVDWATSASGFAGVLKGTVAAGGQCTPKNTSDSAAIFTCENGMACMPGAVITSWTCVPRAAEGGKCFSDVSCQDGLRCDPDQSLPSLGTCYPRKGPGEACTRSAECSSLFCEGTADCASSGSNCTCVEATQARVYCLHAP